MKKVSLTSSSDSGSDSDATSLPDCIFATMLPENVRVAIERWHELEQPLTDKLQQYGVPDDAVQDLKDFIKYELLQERPPGSLRHALDDLRMCAGTLREHTDEFETWLYLRMINLSQDQWQMDSSIIAVKEEPFESPAPPATVSTTSASRYSRETELSELCVPSAVSPILAGSSTPDKTQPSAPSVSTIKVEPPESFASLPIASSVPAKAGPWKNPKYQLGKRTPVLAASATPIKSEPSAPSVSPVKTETCETSASLLIASTVPAKAGPWKTTKFMPADRSKTADKPHHQRENHNSLPTLSAYRTNENSAARSSAQPCSSTHAYTREARSRSPRTLNLRHDARIDREVHRFKRLSKKLAHVLRHEAFARGIQLSADGFAPLAHVLEVVGRGNYRSAEVRQVVSLSRHSDSSPRFELREDPSQSGQQWIRATRYHSIAGVDIHAVRNTGNGTGTAGGMECPRDDRNMRRLSKAFTQILRYNAGNSAIRMSPDGFVPLELVMAALRSSRRITLADVGHMVRTSLRRDGTPRFELTIRPGGQHFIRASLRHT